MTHKICSVNKRQNIVFQWVMSTIFYRNTVFEIQVKISLTEWVLGLLRFIIPATCVCSTYVGLTVFSYYSQNIVLHERVVRTWPECSF